MANGEPPAEYPQESHIQDYVTILLRGKWTILITFIVIFGLTAIYTFRSKPVYESTAMVLIDMKAKQGAIQFVDLSGAAAASKITNELETLKSNSLAEAVAQALLGKMYLDAEGKERIPMLEVASEKPDAKRLATLQEVTKRIKMVVEFIPIKESDIIRIAARSKNAREAALLANTYTECYLERNVSSSRARSRVVREFLQNQMKAKHSVLDSTEHQLQSYMRNSGVVDLDSDTKKTIDQLSQLEASRDAIDVEISSRSRTLASYRQELAQQEPNAARAIGESNDAYIRLLQEQLARLEVQRDVVIAQNPGLTGDMTYSQKLKEIDAQIVSLKRNLTERTQGYLNSVLPGESSGSGRETTTGFLGILKQKIIEQQIELDGLAARKTALKKVIADYETQFNKIPEKSIDLAKLQRARLSGEKLYLLVEEKFNEAAITETSDFGYINIMDPASVPDEPVSPNVMRNLILGVFLGLGLGVGIVLLRAYWDDRVRTPEELKSFGFTPLSTVSRIIITKERRRDGSEVAKGEKDFDSHLVTYFVPFSPFAESFRHLRTNVSFARPDNPVKTIVVTSGSPREGKSTIAANLAVSFAQDERKVLFVEADMRRPKVHEFFGLPEKPGLTDFLFGKEVFANVVHTSTIPNLDILCCGRIPPNPAEVLGSKRMKAFVAQMRQMYEVVLFDTPPLLAVTDAAVISAIADGVLLVVSSGMTRRVEIEGTTEALAGVGAILLGIVLNNLDVRHAYGRYRSTYGYGYYTSPNARKMQKAE